MCICIYSTTPTPPLNNETPPKQPTDVVRGNRTLNLGFCAHLFNRCPGLEAVTEEDFVGFDFSALEVT